MCICHLREGRENPACLSVPKVKCFHSSPASLVEKRHIIHFGHRGSLLTTCILQLLSITSGLFACFSTLFLTLHFCFVFVFCFSHLFFLIQRKQSFKILVFPVFFLSIFLFFQFKKKFSIVTSLSLFLFFCPSFLLVLSSRGMLFTMCQERDSAAHRYRTCAIDLVVVLSLDPDP